jgi:hypothetical protein
VFNRKPAVEVHELDETITSVISEISGLEAGTEQYTAAAGSLKVLIEARAVDKATAKPKISPDAIMTVAGNLLGIGLILGFEKANVITTKSLSFVPKVKN